MKERPAHARYYVNGRVFCRCPKFRGVVKVWLNGRCSGCEARTRWKGASVGVAP